MCPDVDDGAPNYSYAFSEDAFDKPYRRFTQVVRPSEKILIYEWDFPDDGHFNVPNHNDQPSIHHFRYRGVANDAHGRTDVPGRGNYGFCDGHVESLPRKDIWDHADRYWPLWK